MNFREELSNDFTLDGGTGAVQLHASDMKDWKITFVDTGMHSNIGQRLLRARKFLEGEEMFLANYADGLSNVPIDKQIAQFSAGTGQVPLDAVEPKMIGLALAGGSGPRRVLCIGAHCDDIEIGCAGALLQLQKGRTDLTIDWVVLTGDQAAGPKPAQTCSCWSKPDFAANWIGAMPIRITGW
jgi:hypothetical protein